jgi:Subtilase family
MGSLTMHLVLAAGFVGTALVSGAGAQIGVESGGSSSSYATPIVLSRAQQRSMTDAYAWLDRDAWILTSVLSPRTVFVETPRLKERTDFLNVKVKSRAQMLTRLAYEEARAQMNAPQSTSRVSIESAQAIFAAKMAQADERIIDARARLAPSLREAFDDIDMHSVRLPDGISAEAAAEALMLTGDYEFVSIDWRCYPTDTTPNDPLFGSQWHHASDRIDTVGAWDFTQGESSTIIGVCDSGVDLDHPDLAAALVPGYNSVDDLAQVDGGQVNSDLNGHGTLVAGAAAAIGNNSTGVSGVGWNFGIMPVRVTNTTAGDAFLSDILQGARWASDNGAYASNCSFGGAEDAATRSSGGHIRLEGHLLVFAAGNDGLANQTNDWEQVTIVGASTQSDNWATFSHTGIGIDCIAPGVNIRSTNRNGGYSFTTGTSFSSPITAAAMMLVHDANPALSADEVEFILLNACDDKQAVGQDDQTGWGRINVGRAVEDAIFGPSITSLPFLDTFADETLSTDWRNPVGDIAVSSDGVNEPTAPYALNLDDSDSIETISMRATSLLGSTGEIRFSAQHRGVEGDETLGVEYYDLFGNWQSLASIDSDGQDQDEFVLYRFLMPGFGLHDAFKLRFAADGSDTTDDWYIDDVAVQSFVSNTLPWEDGFEDGITLTLDWASSDAVVSTDASNEPDGSMSALLTGSDSMSSAAIDITQAQSAVYVHFYTQHSGVESGETLEVEYLSFLGEWKPLMTIASDGSDPSSFEFAQIVLPFDGYSADLAIRFTADGDESDDAWFLDAVAVTTELIEDQPCDADLTGDGELNFFDVSAFLTAFSALDPLADFTGDGLYNFFDVSAFLTAFSEGCP